MSKAKAANKSGMGTLGQTGVMYNFKHLGTKRSQGGEFNSSKPSLTTLQTDKPTKQSINTSHNQSNFYQQLHSISTVDKK